MRGKAIRAILIQPGTARCVDDIEDTLPTFQRIVGGYIEQDSSEDLRISFWLNESGKIDGLPVRCPGDPIVVGHNHFHGR
jgi:hypothetical protein